MLIIHYFDFDDEISLILSILLHRPDLNKWILCAPVLPVSLSHLFFPFTLRYDEDMYVLTVIPLVHGTLKGALTYFSKDFIEIGYIVTVPLRGREVSALVTEVNDVSNEKTLLKNSDYKIKKIVHANSYTLWDESFIKAIKETSFAHFQPFGETLIALTPKVILDEYSNKQQTTNNGQQTTNKGVSSSRIFAIQDCRDTRIKQYHHLVQKSFKQNKSIFICAPSQEDIEKIAYNFKTNKERCLVFHGGISKKKILKQWKEAVQEKSPLLVIGTPLYLSLPRHFETFILEEEHSRHWKTFTRPFIDVRSFIEILARESESAIILGAPLLHLETQKRIIDKEIRLIHDTERKIKEEFLLIDPRIEEKNIKEYTGSRTVQILGKEIRALIEHAQENNENIFLLVARKGLAPLVVCGDCGTVIRCKVCNKLLVLHKGEKEKDARIFSCHTCGFHRAPEDGEHEICPICGGWRLEGLGIGIERVENEIKRLFPSAEYFILDGDHTKTRASARKAIGSFEKSKKGILIGTPMAIPFLPVVSATAIVSLDSLFAIPDFSMNERIFALILTLREKTKGKFLAQTRLDDTTLFEQALEGDTQSFVKDEIMIRKTFSYPPYGTIIKVTIQTPRAKIVDEMEKLKSFLSEYAPLVQKTITHKKNVFQMSMILKLKENSLSDKKLLSKLNSLPSQFIIEVNPDSLF